MTTAIKIKTDRLCSVRDNEAELTARYLQTRLTAEVSTILALCPGANSLTSVLILSPQQPSRFNRALGASVRDQPGKHARVGRSVEKHCPLYVAPVERAWSWFPAGKTHLLSLL